MAELDFNSLGGHFQSIPEQLPAEYEQRQTIASKRIGFGVSFLDDALLGVYPGDLTLIGARTGLGKTELVTTIARKAVEAGKRVHFFALEADYGEIAQRLKWQVMTRIYFQELTRHTELISMHYRQWNRGLLTAEALIPIEQRANAEIREKYNNLKVFYREKEFTLDTFRQLMLSYQAQSDLFIIDHLHYFDHDEDNENRALKAIIKGIKDMVLICRKPVILVAHLRKKERFSSELLPTIDDFHGSSDLTKTATQVILLGSGKMLPDGKNRTTFFQVVKYRLDSTVTQYAAILNFNTQTKSYASTYFLGSLSQDNTEFQAISSSGDAPYWATSISYPKTMESQ